MLRAPEPPTEYEGLVPTEPQDGLYLDQHGRPLYIAGGREVPSAKQVVAALGEEAEALLEKLGDADTVLERLGRAF